jgi:hypothetical protein
VLLFFSHGAIVILALVLLLILHWCYCSSCVVLLFFPIVAAFLTWCSCSFYVMK